MKLQDNVISKTLPAIKVHQWLDEWEKVEFNPSQLRRKPEPHFYMFTLSARELKSLAGIYRRSTEDGFKREDDLNIQRRHNKVRSLEIHRFVEVGFPLSETKKNSEDTSDFNDLRKPGWLPTSLVINILRPDDYRKGQKVDQDDLISVSEIDDQLASISLPKSYVNKNWHPTAIYPIEIIDGQHRLWAFENTTLKGNFELPVVAFYGLDISWQAYLFWVINIKPKKINTSLAFDLYPLLRIEDWLERFEGPKIYRETRAQELTEALWSYQKSSWYQRIDMLGEHGQKMVSQASWINSLLNTFVKSWEGKGIRIGGLFGAPIGKDELALGWSRTQQAAFLIFIWNTLSEAVRKEDSVWASILRKEKQIGIFNIDPAFSGASTLLNTDQGVRGVMYTINDICYIEAMRGNVNFEKWRFEEPDDNDSDSNAISPKLIGKALISLNQEFEIIEFIKQLCSLLTDFDWRSASDLSLSDNEKTAKLAFRGSGGYRELRRQLLKHIISKDHLEISSAAEDVYKKVGFN